MLQAIVGGGGPGSSLAATALSQPDVPDVPTALTPSNAPHVVPAAARTRELGLI